MSSMTIKKLYEWALKNEVENSVIFRPISEDSKMNNGIKECKNANIDKNDDIVIIF